jgi:hypothetical protein
MPTSIELRLVKPAATPARHGPAVFAVVRNESYFLPFFFAHYRALGVETFLVYDDRSDDGTLDFLAAQPDCAVVTSDHRFGDDFGLDAHNAPRRLSQALKEGAPEAMLAGRWVVTADADEFLVLPSGYADLNAFTAALDRIGQPYATAPMVDFYGETLAARNHGRDVDPFAGSPWFDAGPYYVWTGEVRPAPLVAGFRFRLMLSLHERYPAETARIYGDELTGASQFKAPLLKHGAGVVRVGDHTLSIAPRGEVCAALAHFKLYPDLDAKIAVALRERQYANGSKEYAFLEAAIRLMGEESLLVAQSRRFEGPGSLERAGLLRGP